MFTGIVTHRGRIASIESGGTEEVVRLLVVTAPALANVGIGDSVALDGCCLTVAALDDGGMAFDAIPETLRKTTLGDRAVGDLVNLEGALRMGDALGGHWVQGHVDGVGTLRALETQGEDVRMAIALPQALRGDVLPKGSITVDGVSLTVGEVWIDADDGAEMFSVYLIPHTLEITGLGAKAAGDRVNLEADVMGRWVRHHLDRLHE